ncbi:putative esophageal gland cell secretory protein 21 [Aphelenchoides besseyi]|nr:putative esophageal gland cell secretory protein 21 [Aphelenchoides besseyi]
MFVQGSPTSDRSMIVGFFFVSLTLLRCDAAIRPEIFKSTANADDQLVLVQSLWRHDNNTWPQGWGQLTLTGMKQHYYLGQRLKKKYTTDLKFTPSKFNQAEVYIRSTDLNRTLQSAMSNLVGFFDRGTEGVDYPKDLDSWPTGYVPIPIHTVDDDFDYLINPDRYCPRSNAIRKFLMDCDDIRSIVEQHKDLLDKLTKISGMETTIWNMWEIYDSWYIDRLYGKPLPPEFTDELFANVTKLNNIMEDVIYGIGVKTCKGLDIRNELTKLRGGPLIWSIIEHMQQKRFCINTPVDKRDTKAKQLCKWMDKLKYFVYSAHDSTIAALFSTLGFNETNFDEPGFPHYSACVTVELWKSANGYYVKVFYWVPPSEAIKNRTHKEDVTIDLTSKIVDCTDKCDLDQFSKRSEPYKLSTTPQKLCDDTNLPPNSMATGKSIFLSAILLSLLTLIWL